MSTALMHDFTDDRTIPSNASPFYKHPYGGIARDVWVDSDQFSRFFGINQWDLDNMHANCKWFDIMEAGAEILGYKIVEWHKNWMQKDTRYRITIITNDHSRINKLMEIAPYLWEGIANEISNPAN